MASSVLSETQSRSSSENRLSLCIDVPPSSSPFPSPSSSFLPPPIPGVHEFAVKIPPGRTSRTSTTSNQNKEKEKAMEATANLNGNGAARSQHTKASSTSSSSGSAGSPILSPSTPTPGASHLPSSPVTTPTKSTIGIPATDGGGMMSSVNHGTALHSHRDSLTSSRPAPPSPSISRRASAAPSTHSSKSRASSTAAISRANSARKSQRLSQLTSTISPSPKQQQQQRASAHVAIKIRDFGFAATDDRHYGLGPDVPKPNRPKTLNKKLGAWRRVSSGGVSTSDDSDQENVEEEEEDGWGGFKFGVGRFSWGPGMSMSGSSSESATDDRPAGTEEGYPSLNDLKRNFDDDDDEGFYDAEEGYDDDGGLIHSEDTPLYPGLYRAMYAFEPEGTAEMALEEDQIVKVVGRGGGVGWAVVDKAYAHGVSKSTVEKRSGVGEGNGHALVPESYLEVYQLDSEVTDN
ncbi:hypothetical protein BDN71DRAFT_1494194 [Pleurotus eryngii]|uniref:SH3 domain-containing protein n=1 Tax=Pleurotus eryngii TaxID=5323 RepID=A0A9P6A5V4_PLEER|nr:hypothetical protein BDN71DRAFT_1494194 [Pleurotus eryngii]